MPKPSPKQPDRKPITKTRQPDPEADEGSYQVRERQLCAAYPILTLDTKMSRDDVIVNVTAAGLVGAFYGDGKRPRFLLAEADAACPQTTCHHFDVSVTAKGHVKLRIISNNRRNNDLMEKILAAALQGDKHTVRELVIALRIAPVENDSERRRRRQG